MQILVDLDIEHLLIGQLAYKAWKDGQRRRSVLIVLDSFCRAVTPLTTDNLILLAGGSND